DIAPRSVYRITSATNPNEVLYQATDQVSARVFSEEVGREVRSTLRSAITQGTGRNANISGLSVSGKTGTAQNYHDAWFVGWADGVTTAVWMGHPEAQIEMRDVRGRDVTGGSFPAEIWRDFTEAATEARPGSGLTDAPFAGRQNRSDDEQRTIPTLEEIGRAP
ncbi:MAG: penicillin-binding transpeptidase domain-containing protein, partial [Coriobacteriia bacterium]|nr:penicillin-binding transpeptidase domain-containing protein [Coriobacteriia bacterium]